MDSPYVEAVENELVVLEDTRVDENDEDEIQQGGQDSVCRDMMVEEYHAAWPRLVGVWWMRVADSRWMGASWVQMLQRDAVAVHQSRRHFEIHFAFHFEIHFALWLPHWSWSLCFVTSWKELLAFFVTVQLDQEPGLVLDGSSELRLPPFPLIYREEEHVAPFAL